MILSDRRTWPADLVEFLDSHFDSLSDYVAREQETMHAYLNQSEGYVPMALMPSNPFRDLYYKVVQESTQIASSQMLRGWHCTRVTDSEAEYIAENGMLLLSNELVAKKVELLRNQRLISDTTAKFIIEPSIADDECRTQMIWFCFFEPRLAWQSGIERFFRFWGGEAIYAPQHSTPVLEELGKIGRPCLIEVDVPISSLATNSFLGEKIVRNYLRSHGINDGEDEKHEDRSTVPLAAQNIIRFIFHGEQLFDDLTGCGKWEPPLE